jgi:hypothetical protein
MRLSSTINGDYNSIHLFMREKNDLFAIQSNAGNDSIITENSKHVI